MPAKRAASGLVPSIWMRSPSAVRSSTSHTIAAMTMKTMSGIGTPAMAPLPRKAKAAGKPRTALPPVIATARPVKIRPVPSVARIGGRPKMPMTIPLSSPHTAPTTSAAAIASAIVPPPTRPTACGPASVDRSRAAMTAARLDTPTTDRSMPPVIIDSIMASDRMANSGNWNAIELKLPMVRKRDGSRAAITTKMMMVSTESCPISDDSSAWIPRGWSAVRGAVGLFMSWSILSRPSMRRAWRGRRAGRYRAGSARR